MYDERQLWFVKFSGIWQICWSNLQKGCVTERNCKVVQNPQAHNFLEGQPSKRQTKVQSLKAALRSDDGSYGGVSAGRLGDPLDGLQSVEAQLQVGVVTCRPEQVHGALY